MSGTTIMRVAVAGYRNAANPPQLKHTIQRLRISAGEGRYGRELMQDEQQPDLIGLSAAIVSAYVAKNHIQTVEISQLIASVHDALRNVAKPAPQPEKHEPPVPINKTIRPDYIISLEDGRRYKSLKRHLSSRGLTPEEYRKKWGLRPDYPMVASSYAKARSELAKALGLGQKRRGRKRAAKKDSVA
jgi:predicted transcriptional regulator